jgi:hypothetical protein
MKLSNNAPRVVNLSLVPDSAEVDAAFKTAHEILEALDKTSDLAKDLAGFIRSAEKARKGGKIVTITDRPIAPRSYFEFDPAQALVWSVLYGRQIRAELVRGGVELSEDWPIALLPPPPGK